MLTYIEDKISLVPLINALQSLTDLGESELHSIKNAINLSTVIKMFAFALAHNLTSYLGVYTRISVCLK
jgi:hypothetical protein